MSEKQKFNWFDRIEAARERGHFTDEDREKAEDWTTCACGEQDPCIARSDQGDPVDRRLRSLGIHFAGFVGVDAYDDALLTLHRIEARAKELLNP